MKDMHTFTFEDNRDKLLPTYQYSSNTTYSVNGTEISTAAATSLSEKNFLTALSIRLHKFHSGDWTVKENSIGTKRYESGCKGCTILFEEPESSILIIQKGKVLMIYHSSPKVDIIVTVHRRKKFIDRLTDSILDMLNGETLLMPKSIKETLSTLTGFDLT